MNTTTLVYSLKIWITAAFIAPFLQCVIGYMLNPYFDAGYYISTAISMGLFLSLPCAVLFWLSTKLMGRSIPHAGLSRLFLTMPGILFTTMFVYFAQNFPAFATQKLSLPIPYLIVVVAAIWTYEMPIFDKRLYNETVNG